MRDEDFPHDSNDLARLGTRVAEISALVTAPGGVPDVRRILALAQDALPHALHAGLTVLREHGSPETVVVHDELPRRLDLLQHGSARARSWMRRLAAATWCSPTTWVSIRGGPSSRRAASR